MKKGSKAHDELCNAPFPLTVAQQSSEGETSARINRPSEATTHNHPLPSPVAPTEGKLPCTPSTCTLSKKSNQSHHLLSRKTKQLEKVEQQIENRKSQLSALGHYAKRNVNKRDKRAKESLHSLRETVRTLDSKFEEVKVEKVKKRQVKVLLKKAMKRNKHLSALLHTEKQKKLQAQKTCSKLRGQLLKHSVCIPKADHKKEMKEHREKIKALEIQLDILRDEKETKQLSLKDENGYTIETRTLVNELTALELAQSKIGPAIKSVATWLFNCDIQPLPDRKTIQQINDEGHFIAKKYIATRLEASDNWGLNKDGTSRKRKKILDTTVTIGTGETMSLGFREVASETGNTIAEVAQDHLKELAFVSGEGSDFLEKVVTTLSVYMSDRASNEKKSNRVLDEWRQEVLQDTPKDKVPEVHKFYCMAHVLLGFHKNVVDGIGAIQSETGPLGRDKLPQFQHFRRDSVVERVALATSEVFGPVGDYLGLRDLWEVHCANHGIKSRIGSYKDNRFNGLFETSAQILHHKEDFLYILSLRTSNKKLQSVQADLQDPLVMSFSQAMAILYINITGPFWHLMDTGDVPYINLHTVIQPLLEYLETAVETPSLLLDPAGPDCLRQFRGKESQDFIHLLVPLFPEHQAELESCLKAGCIGIVRTIRKQLTDFLPGGTYSQTPSEEELKRTSFAHKTNLSCEHHFGDLDSSQRRRPNCSMHHHSTVQMLKRNAQNIKTWYSGMKAEEQADLWKEARLHARDLRERHRMAEKRERDLLYDTACKKTDTSKKRRLEANCRRDIEENEMDELTVLKTQLDQLMPQDAVFRTDQWVAVAYQDNWYPGLVRGTSSKQSWIQVNFSARTTKPSHFRWPDGKDLQKVEKEFVIFTDFSLEPVRRGRTWTLETAVIDEIYNIFRRVNF